MILFNSVMQKEKLAAIGLVIIIIGALSTYFFVTYGEEILENLFGKEEDTGPVGIGIGDCADVNYIGRFVNGTVFDTNYEDVAIEHGLYNETRDYEPQKVFVNPNQDLTLPEGYGNYSSYFVTGFLNGLVGMKEGETKNVTLPPEDAYGDWNESLAEMFGMRAYPLSTVVPSNATENKTNFMTSFPNVTLTEGNEFDYGAVVFEQAGALNATITNITDENITYTLSPVNGSTVKLPIFNWNVTFIVENETAFTMRSSVEVGHTFSIEYFYGSLHFYVTAVNETHASMAMNVDAPEIKFVGQTLIFELEVVRMYDTST